MLRKIILIDEEKCIGCGACAEACHEGAIQMVNGKARLTREDYCDGLGDCLPACPTNAIKFEEREAPAYDAEAVRKSRQPAPCGCAGSTPSEIHHAPCACPAQDRESQLSQWPVQIKLVPLAAPFFDGKRLLVAADCTAYAYASFHEKFIQGHTTLIGCPKLDNQDYSEKLAAILSRNNIVSVDVVRMEVSCCGGLEYAVRQAIAQSGKQLPLTVYTISTSGEIIEIA